MKCDWMSRIVSQESILKKNENKPKEDDPHTSNNTCRHVLVNTIPSSESLLPTATIIRKIPGRSEGSYFLSDNSLGKYVKRWLSPRQCGADQSCSLPPILVVLGTEGSPKGTNKILCWYLRAHIKSF